MLNRWLTFLAVVGMGWSCAGRGPAASPTPAPPAENVQEESREDEQDVQEAIRAAQRELALGERLLGEENADEARLAFNRYGDDV